uniref:Putative secreted protein n=1 Tax=Anopheles darlingi TaxID=43151 RepID=A0A2M4D908_ANODA
MRFHAILLLALPAHSSLHRVPVRLDRRQLFPSMIPSSFCNRQTALGPFAILSPIRATAYHLPCVSSFTLNELEYQLTANFKA